MPQVVSEQGVVSRVHNQITVEVSGPVAQTAIVTAPAVGPAVRPSTTSFPTAPVDGDRFETEAVPADYLNRKGYALV